MRLHELLMDMITEHNYGVPIPLSHDDHSSHMDDIHTEMEKRLIVFLALPGILFLNHSITRSFHDFGLSKPEPNSKLAQEIRKKLKLPVYNLGLI